MRAPVVVMAGTVVALLAACSGDDAPRPAPAPVETTAPAPTKLFGTVTLRPADSIIGVGLFYEPGARCDGSASIVGRDGRTRSHFGPPASEVREGTSVTVADDKGQTIGSGTLPAGKWLARPTQTNLDDHLCQILFSVSVSRSSPFYAVQVGSLPSERIVADAPIDLTVRGPGTLAEVSGVMAISQAAPGPPLTAPAVTAPAVTAPPPTPAPPTTKPAISDVTITKCGLSDIESLGPEATLKVTNSSSVTSHYSISVAFLSKDGATRFDTGGALVGDLAPGQTTEETATSLKEELRSKAFSCKVLNVNRFAA